MYQFLSVTPMPLKAKTSKNTSDNLRDVIINFDEIKAYYFKTPYEKMFDEAIVNK